MNTKLRRKDTGRPGNAGRFDGHARAESPITLAAEQPAETVFTKRYDSVTEKVEAYRAEIDGLVADLESDDEWLAYLDATSRFHKYSFNNTMLILLQRPDATRVAGFKVWESMGRNVKKGEKGIRIFAPNRRRVEVKDSEGNVVRDAKGRPLKESRVVGVTTATIFDISQTEGEPLPEIKQSLSEEPLPGFREDLEKSIAAAGFSIEFEEMSGSQRGYSTRDGGNRIVLRKGMTPGTEAKVLAHELAHVKAGHLDHLDEYHQGHNGKRGQMEVEAESIAYILCRSNGMETVGEITGTYVAGWAGGNVDVVRAAGETVSKTAKLILEEQEWQNALPGVLNERTVQAAAA